MSQSPHALLDGCLSVDRPRLVKRLRGLNRRPATLDDLPPALRADLEASVATCEKRRARLPQPTFPDELPVNQRRSEIAEAIDHHQVVIVCGETGSGKTTQLPKICLSIGRGAKRRRGSLASRPRCSTSRR